MAMVPHHRTRIACALWAVVSFAWSAESFAKDDPNLGAEFIDMPETEETPTPEEVDQSERPAYVPGYREAPAMGLSPFVPQQFISLPGGVTPAFGAPRTGEGFRFSFTGYLQQPVVMSIGRREQTFEGQKSTTLHGDPVVAGGAWGYFDHTNTVPAPWTQLNFLYGNSVVQAQAILGAWGVGESHYASGYQQINSQVWAQQAFLTYTPDTDPVGLQVRVGGYPDRYGAMSKYTQGAYGLNMMGELWGVGTTGTVSLPFENGVTFQIETGFKGDIERPAVDIIPDNSNEYPIESFGSTFGTHAHLSASYSNVTVGLHSLYTFSQDDQIDDVPPYDERTTQTHPRDGSISVSGVDVRADMARFGYLYAGYAKLVGENALSVSPLLRFLTTGGGKDLSERFWGFGANGNGNLTVLGGQYTLSLGTLLRYPMEFWGDGPDIQISLFGLYGKLGTEAPPAQTDDPFTFDGQKMAKYGAEVTYSLLSWLAASVRADHVLPNLDDADRSFGVISPKITIREDWQSRYTLNLQYAGYVLGDGVRVEGDRRLVNNAFGRSDEHVFALFGTMWW